MSMEQASAGVPEFDLADRMRKALRQSGVGALEMADYLGVSRNTVSNWINGRVPPGKQSIRLWAMKTGVPYEWLHDGVSSSPSPSGPTTPRYRLRAFTVSDSFSQESRLASAHRSGELLVGGLAA